MEARLIKPKIGFADINKKNRETSYHGSQHVGIFTKLDRVPEIAEILTQRIRRSTYIPSIIPMTNEI